MKLSDLEYTFLIIKKILCLFNTLSAQATLNFKHGHTAEIRDSVYGRILFFFFLFTTVLLQTRKKKNLTSRLFYSIISLYQKEVA